MLGWGSLSSPYRTQSPSYSHNGLGSGIVISILGCEARVLPYKAEVPGYSCTELDIPLNTSLGSPIILLLLWDFLLPLYAADSPCHYSHTWLGFQVIPIMEWCSQSYPNTGLGFLIILLLV